MATSPSGLTPTFDPMSVRVRTFCVSPFDIFVMCAAVLDLRNFSGGVSRETVRDYGQGAVVAIRLCDSNGPAIVPLPCLSEFAAASLAAPRFGWCEKGAISRPPLIPAPRVASLLTAAATSS
jgi:hypothetical protein